MLARRPPDMMRLAFWQWYIQEFDRRPLLLRWLSLGSSPSALDGSFCTAPVVTSAACLVYLTPDACTYSTPPLVAASLLAVDWRSAWPTTSRPLTGRPLPLFLYCYLSLSLSFFPPPLPLPLRKFDHPISGQTRPTIHTTGPATRTLTVVIHSAGQMKTRWRKSPCRTQCSGMLAKRAL